MKTRIVTGVTAAVLLLVLVCYGTYTMMLGVVLACAGMAYLEYDRLLLHDKATGRQARAIALLIVTLAAMRHDMALAWMIVWFALVTFGGGCVLDAGATGNVDKAARDWAFQAAGYFYVLSLFGFLVPITLASPMGRQYLLLLFLLVFTGDASAYFVGTWIGRRRLAPGISPKKSVEGSVAAVLTAVLIAAVWFYAIRSGEATNHEEDRLAQSIGWHRSIPLDRQVARDPQQLDDERRAEEAGRTHPPLVERVEQCREVDTW